MDDAFANQRYKYIPLTLLSTRKFRARFLLLQATLAKERKRGCATELHAFIIARCSSEKRQQNAFGSFILSLRSNCPRSLQKYFALFATAASTAASSRRNRPWHRPKMSRIIFFYESLSLSFSSSKRGKSLFLRQIWLEIKIRYVHSCFLIMLRLLRQTRINYVKEKKKTTNYPSKCVYARTLGHNNYSLCTRLVSSDLSLYVEVSG